MDSHGNVHVVEGDEEFDAIVFSAEDKLVIVDFFANWCGPCKQIAPLYASLSQQYTNVIFLKVDVDVLRGTAAKYGVSAMPTFLFFKQGVKVHEFKGANPQELQNSLKMLAGNSQPSVVEEKSSFKYIGQTSYVYWDTGKLDMILEKLLAFNTKLQSQESTKAIALDSKEVSHLNKLIATLKNSTQYHVSTFNEEEHKALLKAVTQWPVAERFPPLDILRLSIVHPEAAKYHATSGIFNKLLQDLHTEEPFANHLMELRFIANSFRFEALRRVIVQSFHTVLDALAFSLNNDNKGVRIACVTVLLNYAICFSGESGHITEKRACIPLLIRGLTTEKEEEGLLRVVVALGTLAYKDNQIREELKPFRSAIQSIKTSLEKVQAAAEEVMLVLDGKTPTAPSAKTQAQIPSIPTPNNIPAGGLPSGINPGMVNTNLMAKMAQNPEILAAAQNPALMSKLQALMADPSKMTQYQGDEELMSLMAKLMGLMNS